MKVGSVPAAKTKLKIRQVWAHNVDAEFKRIRDLAESSPYVAMDTEFPGVIHKPSKHHTAVTPSERYASLKSNVDELHLIQVGLAFAPTADSPPSVAFEINLREFDRRVHPHNPESVDMLARHGLDFARQRADGVEASVLGSLLMSSGLVCTDDPVVTWATFQPAYDFGYLVKLLTGRPLPDTLPEFLDLVRVFFGDEVYDVKHMKTRAAACAWLPGSLDDMASALGVQREAGTSSHQAGSDSALTWDAFRGICDRYFPNKDLRRFAGVLHGLELDLDLAAAGGANGNGNMLANSRAVGGNGNGDRNSRKVAPLPLRWTRP